MLWKIRNLLQYRVHTEDGFLGRIHDVYFDDLSWQVRYLVVDPFSFFSRGPHVLVPPCYLGTPGLRTRMLWVSLSSKQLRQLAPASSDRPVAFREEEKLRYRCYLSPCCEPVMWLPIQTVPWVVEDKPRQTSQEAVGDPHLRSFDVVSRYRVIATDGQAGYASDFILDDLEWSLQQVVIETGHWPRKRMVHCPVGSIASIVWSENAIHLNCLLQTLCSGTVSSQGSLPGKAIDSRIATLS